MKTKKMSFLIAFAVAANPAFHDKLFTFNRMNELFYGDTFNFELDHFINFQVVWIITMLFMLF